MSSSQGHPNGDNDSQPIERIVTEMSRDSDQTRDNVGRQIHRVARALAFPPVLGVILLALVVTGAADESVRESGAALVALVLLAGALILIPPLLYARSPDTYIKLQDKSAEHLAQVLRALSKSPTPPGKVAEPQPGPDRGDR